MNQTTGFLNGFSTTLGGVAGEGISTVEWGKSFINKYAVWLLAILFVLVFGKAFSARI